MLTNGIHTAYFVQFANYLIPQLFTALWENLTDLSDPLLAILP